MLIGAMIVKDEEDYIVRCLQSFIDIVDSVIIIDGGSSDRTVELINAVNLIEKYKNPFYYLCGGRNDKIQVFVNTWDYNNICMFKDQRNFMLDKVREYFSNPYVLLMDADEYLSDGLRKFLIDKKYLQYPDVEMFAFQRRWWIIKDSIYTAETHFDDIHQNSYEMGTIDYQPRLVKLQDKHGFIDKLHETIKPWDKVYHVKDESIYIVHKKADEKFSSQKKYYDKLLTMFDKER